MALLLTSSIHKRQCIVLEEYRYIQRIGLTFHFGDSTCKDFLLGLGFFEIFKNFINNGLGEVCLFAFLLLLLEANPTVKYTLELRGKLDFLLLNESLGLQFGSYLIDLRPR